MSKFELNGSELRTYGKNPGSVKIIGRLRDGKTLADVADAMQSYPAALRGTRQPSKREHLQAAGVLK